MACGSIPDNTVLESDPNAQVPWVRIIESELEVNREIKPLVTEEETEAEFLEAITATYRSTFFSLQEALVHRLMGR